VRDNLSVHKTRAVKAFFEKAKVELLLLPLYSPNLNPREMCWSKLKTYLRAKEVRNYEKLSEAISAAIKEIFARDAQNWIRYWGYVSHSL